MNEEKGRFEETVRSKLYDFESEIKDEDWDRIVSELPVGKIVKLFPLKKYLAVAAAIAALIVGGWYYLNHESQITNHEIQNGHQEARSEGREAQPPSVVVEENKASHQLVARIEEPGNEKQDTTASVSQQVESGFPQEENHSDEKQNETVSNFAVTDGENAMTASSKTYGKNETKRNRRWGFGVGGGRVGIASNTGGFWSNVFAPSGNYDYDPIGQSIDERHAQMEQLTNIENNYFAKLNRINSKDIPYAADIKHKMPISFGFGINYYLNDRWTLQSGLNYTMLRSDWSIDQLITETNDYTQRLHFIGVPLSASYRLGQWKCLGFYASAGGMIEYNIAGNLNKNTFYKDEKLTETASLKMKEPLLSINSKIGIVYPVWRFIHIYAETGVSYYFDNGSYLKTIRSDKPFNISLQAGLSFGF